MPMALQWLSLVGAIWLQSINGTNSNFPAYSSQLKRLLSISQLQLNNLAFASDAGKLLGWFSGIAAAHLPLWLVLLIGSTLGLIGYGLQYLILAEHVSSLSYVHVLLLTILSGNSICWINTVCYTVAIRNFPLDRQAAVGITTSYVGLSAKIYTDVVDACFSSSSKGKAKAYLLLNAVVPVAVCVVTAPIARAIDIGRSKKLAGGFIALFMITIATGIFAVLSSLRSFISGMVPPLLIMIGMGFFLVIPLVVPLAEKIIQKFQQKCLIRRVTRVHNFTLEEGSGDTAENDLQNGGKQVEEINRTQQSCEFGVIEEVGAWEMLKRVEFWLYFFVYFFSATLGLVYLNNLGQIAESRGSDTSTLVSLASSVGFFGRLLPSLLDYFLSRSKYRLSRPASIVMMMAPMSGAFFLLLDHANLALYVSTAIIGISTGAITSIAVSTTTELFGVTNFGVNHNVLVTNIPIGSFLSGDLAALLYLKQQNEQGKCIGFACYRTTFIVWGSLCSLGTLLASILHRRTKKLYAQRLQNTVRETPFL